MRRRVSGKRVLGMGVGGVAVVLSAGAGVGCCAFSAPRYHGGRSDHFDGRRFKNPGNVERHGTGDFLKWVLGRRDRGFWEKFVDAPPGPAPPRRVDGTNLRITFVNHATLLVQTAGINVLTDPIWSERASPVGFTGPRRARPPGIRFGDLPEIDAVLVSHNHYDHLDLPTLRTLAQAFPRAVFVSGLGNRQLLVRNGIAQAVELDWWQSHNLSHGTSIIAVPAQHFSGRGLCDRDATLWSGFVIATPSGRVYFAGDTGLGPHFAQIRSRLGSPRAALLPIGAFRPEWFMRPVHLSPAEAVRAHQVLGAGVSVAMHFGTFNLGDDGQDEAPAELRKAARAAGDARVWILGFGEGREIP